MTVETLDGTNTPIVNAPLTTDTPYTMPAIGPPTITDVVTSSTDGRHRTFTFTIPEEKGSEMKNLIVRRTRRYVEHV